MNPLRNALIAAASFVLVAPAMGQTVGQAPVQRQESPVRIQTTFNLFFPGPTGESEEAQKARDKARRTVYEMAARECDLLREVLARDCRLESVSSTINRQQYGQPQVEGLSVSGSVNLQITLK